MATHQLKSHPGPFSAVLVGEKTFEFRRDDRTPRFETGDTLVLQEFIPCKSCGGGGRVADPGSHGETDPCGCAAPHGKYTGREVHARVTYLLRGGGTFSESFGLEEGYVVMSIKRLRGH